MSYLGWGGGLLKWGPEGYPDFHRVGYNVGWMVGVHWLGVGWDSPDGIGIYTGLSRGWLLGSHFGVKGHWDSPGRLLRRSGKVPGFIKGWTGRGGLVVNWFRCHHTDM